MSSPSPTRAAPQALPTLAALVRRLPLRPPSLVAARLLDRLLWPRLDDEQRQALQAVGVEVEVRGTGLRVRLRLGPRGFAPDDGPPQVRIVAEAQALRRLVRGEDDADRLFFERALMMEGDTAYGLLLKNTLDAIGPLWPPP